MYVDSSMTASKHIEEITVDDKVVFPGESCTALDTNEGLVEVLVRGDFDNFILNDARTEIKRKKIYGKVEVKWDENF
jgi:hypothetical protein